MLSLLGFLVGATLHEPQRVAGQWPLQGLRLFHGARIHSPALRRRQDHWHSLRVEGLDDGIRRRGQELQEFTNCSDVANI